MALIKLQKTWPVLPNQWFRDVSRSLRLHLFAQVVNPIVGSENKKVAIHSNRGIATIHGLLHVLPFSTCVMPVALNIKTYYIGAVSTEALTAFQFASKALEVLIQASITAIVLAFVRKQVLGPSPLPFGGLIAPFRTTDLSFLWSLELWGFFTSPGMSEWHKRVLCFAFPAAVLLAAIVGPSCAVLLIPRPILYIVHKDLFFLDPGAAGTLYPISITADSFVLALSEQDSSAIDLSFTSDSFQHVVSVSHNFTLRDLWFTSEELDISGGHLEARAMATIPSAISAKVLSSTFLKDHTSSVRTLQPYVYTDCWIQANLQNSSLGNLSLMQDQYLSFGPAKQYLDNLVPYTWLVPDSIASDENDCFAVLPIASVGDGFSTAVLSRPPPANLNNPLLMATASIGPRMNLQMIEACTIDASWVESSTSQHPQNLSAAQDLGVYDGDPRLFYAGLKNKHNISLSPEWTRKVLSFMNESDYSPRTSAAPDIATGLSYLPSMEDITYFEQLGWHNAFLSHQQNDEMARYLRDSNLEDRYSWSIWIGMGDEGNWTDPAKLSQIEVRNFVNGYGYDTSTTTVRLSIAVIAIYLFVVTAYLIYSIIIGSAASSWDSIAELVALALNSERLQSLHNTSAGIDTLETYRQPVSIRVNADDSLELVFDECSKNGQYELVEENKEY